MRIYGLICRGLLLAASALLASTMTTTTAFAAEGPFHVEHTWQIGGEGGWDYIAIDPQSDLLYITRGDHVQVINREKGKLVADITGLHGTHGVVFAPGGNGYISDGGGNQVAVFGRRGARPFNGDEMKQMYLRNDQLWTVSEPPGPATRR